MFGFAGLVSPPPISNNLHKIGRKRAILIGFFITVKYFYFYINEPNK
jgi:hypothetical protein